MKSHLGKGTSFTLQLARCAPSGPGAAGAGVILQADSDPGSAGVGPLCPPPFGNV